VPPRHVEDGFALGRWVVSQRSTRGKQSLKDRPDRLAKLDALKDKGWRWKAWTEKWEEMFALLERFVEREGRAVVPSTHVEEGKHLGQWVANVRQFHRRGELSEEREGRLERLPGWSWSGR